MSRITESSPAAPEPDEDLARRICNFMNELLELDSEAVLDLCNHRVPCNQDMADHETVQVVSKTNKYNVGLIGILNGICGIYKDGWGPICALYHENGAVIRFGLIKEERRVTNLCKVCGGRGVISDSHRKDYDCPSCDGDGKNPQTKLSTVLSPKDSEIFQKILENEEPSEKLVKFAQKFKQKAIVEALKRLTDEERLEVILKFCTHCGTEQDPESARGCQCWNDE